MIEFKYKMNSNIFKKNNLVNFAIIFILLFSILYYYVLKINNLPFHADEYEWVGRSYFLNLLINRKLDDPLMNSSYSYDHPKVVYYLYAITLYPDYIVKKNTGVAKEYIEYLHHHKLYQDLSARTPTWDDINYQFQKINNQNLTNCTYEYCKSVLLIAKARRLSLILLALATVITYQLSYMVLRNRFFALISSLYWGMNSIIVTWGLLAMAEGTFLFFFNLGLLLLFNIFCYHKKNKIKFLFFGFISALCFSTKIHGLLLLIIFILIHCINLYSDKVKTNSKSQKYFDFSSQLLLTVITFIVISFILNPIFWKNPIQGLHRLYLHRIETAQSQQVLYPYSALPTVTSRLNRTFAHFYWSNSDHSRIYFFNNFPAIIRIVFSLIGLISFIKIMSINKPVRYFLISSSILLCFISLYLLLDWDRYYNILVLPFILLFIRGIQTICYYIPFTHSFLKKGFTT